MSLIESVLSSIVISLFMSVFVTASLSFVSLKQRVDSKKQEFNRDYFIANSFRKLSESNQSQNIEAEIESWKFLCNELYPKTAVSVHKVGVKETVSLYKAEWNGKKTYMKSGEK